VSKQKQKHVKRFLTILALIAYSQVLAQKTNPAYLDNSVSGIKLRSQKTVEEIFGQGKNYIDQDDETEVANKDGTQLLVMIFNPGGAINEFYSFRVSYNVRNLTPSLKIKTKRFITGKHIRLGLTERQVKSKLGIPTKIRTDNSLTIWNYEATDKDGLYFGQYDFKDGKLVQFWFGEDYP